MKKWDVGYSYLYDYPNNGKELYELIRKKGGLTNTKDTGNITCIVFGDKPPLRIFEEFMSCAKFIPYKSFIKWILAQKDLEADENYKDSKLADASFLSHFPEVNAEELSPFKDVFQIVGTLYDSDEDYKYDTSTSRIIVYSDIKDHGCYTDKHNEGKATCIIYGYLPPRDAFGRNGIKYISYRKFLSWLKKQPVRDPGCYEIKDLYASSIDTRLRPYQQELKNKIFEKWSVHYDIMLQLPTGTGKTVLFTSIINDLTKMIGTKILIIAHRTELIDQIDGWLKKYGIDHGIIQGSRPRQLQKDIQIASIQTITNKRNQEVMDQFHANFIIIDEAHHALADSYQLLWNKYPETWKLGVTATPYRLNHASFKYLFSELVASQPMDKFIQEGFLANYVYLADNPNGDMLKAIDSIKEKSSTGDYKVKTLMDNLNVDKYIKYVVSCYLEYAKGKRGIVYAISVEHGMNLCQAYQSIGVKAEFIDSTTPKMERAEIIDRFRKGEIEIMVNVNIFSEGLDIPAIEFIQMTRPTYSLSMYLQQVGRGLRPNKNNSKCIILDNAGMFEKFGLPSVERDWNEHFLGKYSNDDAELDRSRNRSELFDICDGHEEAMVQLNVDQKPSRILSIFNKTQQNEIKEEGAPMSPSEPSELPEHISATDDHKEKESDIPQETVDSDYDKLMKSLREKMEEDERRKKEKEDELIENLREKAKKAEKEKQKIKEEEDKKAKRIDRQLNIILASLSVILIVVAIVFGFETAIGVVVALIVFGFLLSLG